MRIYKFFITAAVIVMTSCSDNLVFSPAGFLTESLDQTAWDCSAWISATDAPVLKGEVADGRAADGSPWFVSSIANEKEVVSAKWMASGLGIFQLYVNGKPIGDEILKPGFTNVYKTRLSFTYDVTDVFHTRSGASNQISAQLTPGWWGDKIVTPGGYDGMVGKKCAFRSVLELKYDDGSIRLFGTGTDTWKAGICGPVKHAAIFDGETYDAREEEGFKTPEILSTPELNTEFAGSIFPTSGAEVYFREDLALTPTESYIYDGVEDKDASHYGRVIITKHLKSGDNIELSPGQTLVVDFGQNCAGVPEFVFKAREGTKLTCLPSEILNDGNGAFDRGMDGPGGSVHRKNLRTPETGMRLEYIFNSDKSFSTYRPQCTFFGFRYISVTVSAPVIIKSLRSIPVSSITQALETGMIATGNELVNRLISNTLWGQRSNYLSIPTDCPQRSERMGWLADTQVYAGTGSFFSDTRAFFHKWMRDVRDSQTPFGGFPAVAPKAQYCSGESTAMRVGWSDAGIIVPWTIWRQFGDCDIVEENWEAMEKFMTHVDAMKYDHNSLLEENGDYQWADWLSFEKYETSSGTPFMNDARGKRVPVPEALEYWNFLSASYWASDAMMMADMARATGRDASVFEGMSLRARSYIRDRFFDANGQFKTAVLNDMQTPALFALRNDILGGEQKERMKAELRENFRKHGGCLQTGFLGTSILMSVLTDNGMSDLAYDLLLQRKNPSWLYSVDNGATTIWERWNSYMAEDGMEPSGRCSFNHYAYGCVCQWIWETVCGIAADPLCPGFKHIIMKPVPDRRIGFVNAEYRSASGLIKSSWRYEGDKCIWNFSIPEGSTATVILPGSKETEEYPSGSYSLVL